MVKHFELSVFEEPCQRKSEAVTGKTKSSLNRKAEGTNIQMFTNRVIGGAGKIRDGGKPLKCQLKSSVARKLKLSGSPMRMQDPQGDGNDYRV